jgi:hypothetical protein
MHRRFYMSEFQPCAKTSERDCPIDLDLLQGMRDMAAFRRVGVILSGILTAAILALGSWLAGIQSAINELRNTDAERGSRMVYTETTQRGVLTELALQSRQDASQQEAISRITTELAAIQNKLDRLLERQNGGK